MLADVMGDSDKKKKSSRSSQQRVIDEAYPESEFNLHPGAASSGTMDGWGLLHIGSIPF